MKEVCSPVNSMKTPTPLPGSSKNRGVKHTAPYGPPTGESGRASDNYGFNASISLTRPDLSENDPFPPPSRHR